MEEDQFYEAEHFYNDDVEESNDTSEAFDDSEDLSKMGYFELAKRFLGKKELPRLEKDMSESVDIHKNLYVQVSICVFNRLVVSRCLS